MGCGASRQASVLPEPGTAKFGATSGAGSSGKVATSENALVKKDSTQAFAVELWKSSAFDALESILGAPDHIRRHFAAFLADEFSENNLEFWDRVQRLRTLDSNTPEARTEALAIYNRFVKSGSADEVNLPSRLRDASAYTQEMHVQLLTMAQREILLMMSLDAFPRFLRSHHCDAMMAALVADPQQSWSPAGAVATGFHISGGHGNASLAAALGAGQLAMPAGKAREGSLLSGYSRAGSLDPDARVAVTAPSGPLVTLGSGAAAGLSGTGSPVTGRVAGGSTAHGDAGAAAHGSVIPVSAGSNASNGAGVAGGSTGSAGVVADSSGQARTAASGARAALGGAGAAAGGEAGGDDDPTAPPAKGHTHTHTRGTHASGAAAALSANSSTPIAGVSMSGTTMPAVLHPPTTGAAAALAHLRTATATGASSLTGSMESTWTSASRAPESSAHLSAALRAARDQLRSGAGRWLDVFKDVAEFIPSCIVIADMNQPGVPIVYANPAFFTTTGYPKDEVLGRNCRFLQGPETSKEDIEKLRAAIREGRRTNIEILNYKKDGTKFRNFLSISPVWEARKRRVRPPGSGSGSGLLSAGAEAAVTAAAAVAAAGAGGPEVVGPPGRDSSGSMPSSRTDKGTDKDKETAPGAGAAVAEGGAAAMPASASRAAPTALDLHTGLAIPDHSHGHSHGHAFGSGSASGTGTGRQQLQLQRDTSGSPAATASTYDGMEEFDEPGPRKMAFFIGLQFEVLNDAMITGRLLRHEALLRMLPQQVAL